MEHTRDMREWMRAVERKLAKHDRAPGSIRVSVIQQIKDEGIPAAPGLKPAAPVEIVYETALYTDPTTKQVYGRLLVDFPDVTVAADATPITIGDYELWGRDDTMNALEATTSAVAGLAAPGITFPGLAATQANKDISAKNQGPWKLLDTSGASSLRAERLIPGSVWSFRVRAFSDDNVAGLWSAEYQTQIDTDTQPPPQPTAPIITASHGTLKIEWDGMSVLGAMPGDFQYLDVAHGEQAAPTRIVTRMFRGGGVHVLSDFDYYAPQHVRFQAVDYSGNRSAWSEESVGYTTPLVDADVILSEIDGNNTLIKNIGQEAIKDGAILREKLADGSIDLSKLDQSVQDAVAQGNAALDLVFPIRVDLANTQASADGKNSTTNSVSDASSGTPGKTVGDRWQKWSTLATGGKLLASWRWSGTSWIPELMDPTYLPLVDIGQGTFGSLNGSRLEVGSVTAKYMSIGAFDNLVDNPSFESGGINWDSYTASYWTFPTTGGNSGAGVCRFSGTTTRQLGPVSAKVPHEQGDSYRISGWVRTTATTGHTGELGLYWYNANGSYISTSTLSITTATSAWQRFNFTYTPPDTARFVAVRMNATIANAADEYFFDDIALTRATSGELLIDGTVTANKVATNAITARSIVIGDFANIALGSDFEDMAAVPWNLSGSHVQSTANKKSGSASLKLMAVTDPASPAKSNFTGDFRVREGEQWYFSFWVLLESTFNGDPNSKVRISATSGSSALKDMSYSAVTKGSWQKVDGTLTVPAGVTSLYVALWNTQTTGNAYIDDFQIRRVAEPSLIQSLGVEKLTASTAALSQAVIDKLWADVVNSRKITTNMLLVGSGPNMIPNGALELGDSSGWVSGLTFDSTDKPTGFAGSLRSAPASGTVSYVGTFFDVQPNTEYLFEFWLKADKPNSKIYIELRDQNNAHGAVSVNVPGYPASAGTSYPASNVTVPTVWTKYAVAATTTATANKLRVGSLYFNHPNGTEQTATVWVAGFTMRPRADGSIIATGAITAPHLGVDSVTAAAIKALTITANQIAANAIEADKIKAGAVTAAKLEATLILTSTVIAGSASGTHAEMSASGFRVFSEGVGGEPPYEVVRMGVADTSDLLTITDSTGTTVAQISDDGKVTALSLEADSTLYYRGQELQTLFDAMPRGIVTWRQFPRPASYSYPTLPSAGGEVGLFEIGWDTSLDDPARLYKVNVPKMLLKSLSGSASTIGLTMRFTDDGTAPTVNSQLITSDWGYASPGGYRSAGFNNQLVGSANGPYIRVLITMWATGGCSIDNAGLPMISVEDAGLSVPQGGSYTTGGGTVGTGTVSTAPTSPVVTKTVTYNSTSVQSFQGNNARYDWNAGKGYQGLSPAGYGNLKSLWTFPSVTTLLSGATVNKIEAYFYFEHWYNNNGGTARIVAHGNSGQPTTYSSLILAITSGGWPRGAGRWVTIPSSLYAGFKSGTYKGFGLEGDGTYNTYGIANAAKIRLTYTK